MDLKHELAASAVQATPSATVIGMKMAGMSLPEWSAVFAMGFIALQAAYLIWKWQWQREIRRREEQERKRKQECPPQMEVNE